jgi:hypothetical protein
VIRVVVVIPFSKSFSDPAPGFKDETGDASIEGSITAVGCESLCLIDSRKAKDGGDMLEALDE